MTRSRRSRATWIRDRYRHGGTRTSTEGGLDGSHETQVAPGVFARLPAAVREELRRQRLRNDPQGLAGSLRGLGAGQQEPVLARLGDVRIPVLLLTGDLDDKYCDLARRMAAVLPYAHTEIVPDAGHAVHLERPRAFSSAVLSFLEKCLQTDHRREGVRCQ